MPKTFLDRLDALSEKTGVPALARGTPRRRHLRWTPVVALVLASAGLAVGLAAGPVWRNIGYAVLMVGFSIATMLPLLGPLKPWGTAERVDEFDRATRDRAFFVAFASVSVAAVIGIWLVMGFALLVNWSRETLLWALALLSLYLMTLYGTVPTLHASWATRPIGDDED